MGWNPPPPPRVSRDDIRAANDRLIARSKAPRWTPPPGLVPHRLSARDLYARVTGEDWALLPPKVRAVYEEFAKEAVS